MLRAVIRQRRRTLKIFGATAALGVILGAQAPTLDPTPVDKATARIVAALLERDHLSKPVLDDEVSKKWARKFIKDLDPLKHYFLKGDLEKFLSQDTNLDDKIREGDIEFAREVFQVFLKRVDERQSVIMDLLKQKPDFTLDESSLDDPDKLDYAADTAEANERWRKRIKLDLLEQKYIFKVSDEEAVRKLTIRYKDRNRFWHQFDTTDLLEVYLSALTTAIDPHSSYMGAKTWEDMLQQQLHLSLEGIGAQLVSEDGYAVVKEIVPGGAADKDGRMQPEDKILGIQKDDGNEVDFVEKKLSDVVRFIRGKAGSKVKLIIQPFESKDRKIYEITRQKIELKEQHAKGTILPIKSEEGKELKVGVISLPAFYGDTTAVMNEDPDAVSATLDCKKILDDFKTKGVDGVLLDLRGNGGGLLLEAITLSGLFIDEGPVVQVREASGVKHMDDDKAGTAFDGPLAVLIDRTSASASEIFAGVIKDYGRGLIIGDSSTFGKGTVQSILPINEQLRARNIPNLGALKLTIQQFYRANGESTQIRGVVPDIHIPSIRDQVDFGEGKMENALEFNKVESLPHDMFNRVPNDLISRLQARSETRRKGNEKFQKLEDAIRKYNERKARHAISLNEAKFKEEFVTDEDADKANEDEKREEGGRGKKRITERSAWDLDSYYNKEVMEIVADYLTLGSKILAAAPVKAADAGR